MITFKGFLMLWSNLETLLGPGEVYETISLMYGSSQLVAEQKYQEFYFTLPPIVLLVMIILYLEMKENKKCVHRTQMPLQIYAGHKKPFSP